MDVRKGLAGVAAAVFITVVAVMIFGVVVSAQNLTTDPYDVGVEVVRDGLERGEPVEIHIPKVFGDKDKVVVVTHGDRTISLTADQAMWILEELLFRYNSMNPKAARKR